MFRIISSQTRFSVNFSRAGETRRENTRLEQTKFSFVLPDLNLVESVVTILVFSTFDLNIEQEKKLKFRSGDDLSAEISLSLTFHT